MWAASGDLLAVHLVLLVGAAAGEHDQEPDDHRQGQRTRDGVAEQQPPALGPPPPCSAASRSSRRRSRSDLADIGGAG